MECNAFAANYHLYVHPASYGGGGGVCPGGDAYVHILTANEHIRGEISASRESESENVTTASIGVLGGEDERRL